uniref:Histone-lysine N-methyltransferase n=1 Tax=Bursaphelenchus xylophilus TaxID=6326 RepID=A0A1I7SU76_BURXY
MDVPINTSFLNLLDKLSLDSKNELDARITSIYWNARCMKGNVVQNNGNRTEFPFELSKDIVSKLSEFGVHEVQRHYEMDIFDIVSAFCDFFFNNLVEHVDDITVDFYSIARQLYISQNDLMDFVVLLLEATDDGELSLEKMYLNHLWDPQRILLFCTYIHVGIHRPGHIYDLEKFKFLEYDKLHKPSLTNVLYETLGGLENTKRILETIDPKYFQLQVENYVLPELAQMFSALNVNKDAFLESKKALVKEMEEAALDDFELHSIPELDLVGESSSSNMEVFKKMTEYKLCDHISLDYEKKMNIGRHEKLWVEMDEKFHEGHLHSWLHDEEEDRITHVKVEIKVRSRKIVREVDASRVARASPVGAMCNAGTRVLAKYKGIDENKWKWGTLGTFPIKEYRFHYLVFFDDGTVQFIRPKNLYLCIVQPKAPNSDDFSPVFAYKYVKGVRSAFLKHYFSLYPSWPLMNVQLNTSMLVNREVGKKKTAVKAMVIQKDRCLLLVRFLTEFDEYKECKEYPCSDHSHQDEWIFAGDTMRIPTLKNILAKVETATDLNTYPEKVREYIEMLYPKYEVDDVKEFSILDKCKVKNTARKTGNKKEPSFFDFFNNAKNHHINVDQRKNVGDGEGCSKDQLIPEYLEYPNWDHLHRRPHSTCSSECLLEIRNCHLVGKHAYKDVPAFFRPFLYGFRRISLVYFDVEVRDDNDEEKNVETVFVYEAPCGRLLRSLDEVAFYLHVTKSELISIDQFTFRIWDRPNFIYRSDPKYLVDPDFAHCKEAITIPTVNSVDDEGPPLMLYQSSRCMDEPLLETQMEFTSCCSCTDDCLNSDTCECQLLTKETHQRLDERIRSEIPDGYKFRRLERKLFSGVYECNMGCSCSTNCLNRVVQRDICVPMQLFKTAKKGWGVRTLVDIPQGQFVCTYSGQMFTDVKADEHVRKGQGSDMYFADVDLFDSVEGMKMNLNIPYPDDEGIEVEEKKNRKKKRKRNKWTHQKRGRSPVITDEKTLLHHLFGESRLFVVDAQERGNLGRFFNHSCDPNMEVQMVFSDTHDIRLPMIAFFTSCDVEAGTELCWNYGYVAGSVPGKVIECSCGSVNCIGRIL